MKTIKVHVNQKHIDTAIVKNSHHCMIADAIHETVPGSQYITVDLQSVRFSNPKAKKRYTYFTPPVAQIALIKFDQGLKVEPFEFTLLKGLERGMGWKAAHPHSSRKGKKWKKTGKRRILPKAERQFGLRTLVS